MLRKSLIGISIVLTLALVVVLGILFLTPPAIRDWPFHTSRTELRLLLGMEAAPWLERAEVVAWAPDPNYKPLKYFISAALPVENFKAWAGSLKLSVAMVAAGPGGAMALPEGVRIQYWVQPSSAPCLEALGTVGKADVRARWLDGRAFIVVAPEYD